MKLSSTILFDREAIASRIEELAKAIDADLIGTSPIALIALKGAMPMAMDLVRAMKTPLPLELIRAKSYEGAHSTGAVTFPIVPEGDWSKKTVLLIEDIIDTGRTATAIIAYLRTHLNAQDIRIVSLLDKPARREVQCEANWVGFTIDDVFVVGYGMDYNEAYRDLPDIHTMEPSG